MFFLLKGVDIRAVLCCGCLPYFRKSIRGLLLRKPFVVFLIFHSVDRFYNVWFWVLFGRMYIIIISQAPPALVVIVLRFPLASISILIKTRHV